MELKFFWDTYAIIEFLHGNPKFARFIHEPVTITIFNLAEIFWISLNEYDKETAIKIYKKYKNSVVEVDDETLIEAIKFRKKIYKNKKLSYADAIGYIYSSRNGMGFLTGDKEFEDMENVEFVK